MFRDLSRKQQQLSHADCLSLLRREKRGVLSVLGDDGYPYGMPMDHFYCEEDGALYFHCGRTGHRLDALKRCNQVSFCVYDGGKRIPEGWALKFQSVIVFGRVEVLDDFPLTCEISARLSRKFTQDEAYIRREIQCSGKNTLLLRLVPEHICGKRVTEA